MNEKFAVEVAGLTDVGRQRENNEDSYLYWEPSSAAELQRKGRLAIVADGMGGYEGGQEASHLAVQTVCEVYDHNFRDNPQATLTEAFAEAQKRILDYAVHHPDLEGMGTTCTALALCSGRLYFAHVGDSRLYLVRASKITRLTRDHSYVGRLVESGIVRPEDAETHPQRHILTAALGVGTEVVPDTPESAMALEDGDVLLLCTDGLWGVMTEAEISAVVSKNPPAESCRALVDLALEHGGPDNITLQILKIAVAS
jgi:serine/threonine protein phosphatase PrpC